MSHEWDFGADAVQADQLACHVEAGDLLAAVLRHHRALEESEPHGVQRFESVAGAEQRVAPFDPLARRDQFVQSLDFLQRQADRKAQFAQVAVGAGNPQSWRC